MYTLEEIKNELVGKDPGTSVQLADGVYPLNIFEYHVEGNQLVAKYNLHTDDKQLNFDSVLFPETAAAN